MKDTEEETNNMCIEGTTNTKCYLPNLVGKTKAEVDKWSTTLPVSVMIKYVGQTSDKSIVKSVSQKSNSLLVEGSTITFTFKDDETSNNENETENEEENSNNNQTTDTTKPGEESTDPDSKPMDPNTGIDDDTTEKDDKENSE